MRDFQSLRPNEFQRLSSAEQRQYLRIVAEHLAGMTRLHAEMAQPRMVIPERPENDDPS